MPYYVWRGIDLAATKKRGTSFARSAQELDRQLFAQAIALLSSRPVVWRWRGGPIRLRHLVESFGQLAALTGSGVLLPESLAIVAGQAKHPGLQEIMHTIADEVSCGSVLSNVMLRYPTLFSAITIQLVSVGEESGSLARALDAIASHLKRTDDFYTRLRAALLLPVITLIFSLAIASAIFVFVIPYFADLFGSMGHDLPLLTRTLIAISGGLRSWYAAGVLGLLGVSGLMTFLVARRPAGKRVVDKMLLRIPIIGPLLRDRFTTYLLHATGLMIEGGIPLSQALALVSESIDNVHLRSDVVALERAITSGSAMSDAIGDLADCRFGADLVAMLRVGEESGHLAAIMKKSAAIYHERLMRRLIRLMALLQPLLIVMLGILIAALVFAIYGPIVTMARLI